MFLIRTWNLCVHQNAYCSHKTSGTERNSISFELAHSKKKTYLHQAPSDGKHKHVPTETHRQEVFTIVKPSLFLNTCRRERRVETTHWRPSKATWMASAVTLRCTPPLPHSPKNQVHIHTKTHRHTDTHTVLTQSTIHSFHTHALPPLSLPLLPVLPVHQIWAQPTPPTRHTHTHTRTHTRTHQKARPK